MRLVFVGIVGSPENIEVHNHRLVVRFGPVMDELHGTLRVIHDTSTSLRERPDPFRLAVVERRSEKAPRCQALDNEPHGS